MAGSCAWFFRGWIPSTSLLVIWRSPVAPGVDGSLPSIPAGVAVATVRAMALGPDATAGAGVDPEEGEGTRGGDEEGGATPEGGCHAGSATSAPEESDGIYSDSR